MPRLLYLIQNRDRSFHLPVYVLAGLAVVLMLAGR